MIINMTPHPVNILDENGKEVATFESAGQIRLASKSVKGVNIDGIPTSRTVFGEPEGLPSRTWVCPDCGKVIKSEDLIIADTAGPVCPCGENELDTVYYIVSQLVKSALSGRADLLVPAEVVRDSSGNIIGCQSLGR